jgi:hypothetical protein
MVWLSAGTTVHPLLLSVAELVTAVHFLFCRESMLRSFAHCALKGGDVQQFEINSFILLNVLFESFAGLQKASL